MQLLNQNKWHRCDNLGVPQLYQVMLFGLSNAPANFQGYINKILTKKLDIFIIVYLNGIIIYTKDPGQAHVEAVW